MDAARLRRNVTIAVVGATTAVAVAIAANPLPGSPPGATVSAAPGGDEASLSARESRAAARLAAAEEYVRAIADARDASEAASAAAAVPASPVVSVAPASPAVVSSGSS